MDFLNNIFLIIADLIYRIFDWILPEKFAELLMVAVYWLAIVIVCVLCALFYVLWERKLAGYIQRRPGPNRLGPNGWFQTIADAMKLVMKEDIVPEFADKPVHLIAALIAFVPPMLGLAAIPFGEGMVALDLDLGIFYLMAVTSLSIFPVLLAGYGSNNKYSMIGAIRGLNQMISYEVPMVFAMLAVVMVSGTYNMSDMVYAQMDGVWYVFLQPVAFVLFIICAVAECNRAPFDLPEGESELTAGAFTEYSGMRWALFYLGEYCNMFLSSGIVVTLFLGGWSGIFLPGWIWFLIKTFAVMTFFIWIRWTFPRMRADHLLNFGWKFLVPLSLANVLITGLVLFMLN